MTKDQLLTAIRLGFSNKAAITLQSQLDMGTLPRPVVRGEKVRTR